MRTRLLALGVEAWAGLVLLGLAILYWLQADALPHSVLGGSVGSDGLPKLLGAALGFMSCLLVIQAAIASPEAREKNSSQQPSRAEFLRALGFWVIAAGFVLILPWAGYPAAVAAVLTAIGMYYGRTISIRLLAFGIGGAAVFYLMFAKLLGVPMPLGTWFDLLNR
jgi:hypothetical protein